MSVTIRRVLSRCCFCVVAVLSGVSATAEYAAGVLPSPAGRRVEKKVARGVVHISDFIGTGPLTLDVVQVDLSDPFLTVEVEPGQDQLYRGESVPATVKRESRPGHTVIAGVNADFWAMSPVPFTPAGMLVANGMIGRLPRSRSVFGITEDERVFMDPVTLEMNLRSGKKRLQIERLNDPAPRDAVTLFTPLIGPIAPRYSGSRVVLRLRQPELLPNRLAPAVVDHLASGDEEIEMTSSTLVVGLSAREVKRMGLAPGAEVVLDIRVPEVNGAITFCCGAAPRILRDGKLSIEAEKERLNPAFAPARHPRTAVGVSPDGKELFLVTADGRLPGASVGATLEELALYMLGLGCSDAVNLDGGGSTTMVVRGEIVNRPSDFTGARKVVNSLLVVSSAPPGELAGIELSPKGNPLAIPAGAPLHLAASGLDSNYTPLPLDQKPLTWSADKLGKVQPLGGAAAVLITGPAGGKGSVRASAGSVSSQMTVEAIPVSAIAVEPAPLVLSSGESVDLSITATGGGRELFLQPEMVKLSPSDPSLSASLTSAAGVKAGEGVLSVRIGSAAVQVPYSVDQHVSRILEPFDEVRSDPTLQAGDLKSAEVGLEIVREDIRQGSGALKLTYVMKPGDEVSQISLPVQEEIAEEPAGLALWIYGDGKQAWVRGKLKDAAGRTFTADFTGGGQGVVWENEWRRITVPLSALSGKGLKTNARPRFPVTFESLTVMQEQDALKGEGTLRFDSLEAVYPPATPGSRR